MIIRTLAALGSWVWFLALFVVLLGGAVPAALMGGAITMALQGQWATAASLLVAGTVAGLVWWLLVKALAAFADWLSVHG